MSTAREIERARTKARLSRAALELGPQATVEAIARRAGYSRRVFFNYFATKDEALAAAPPIEYLHGTVEELKSRPADEPNRLALARAMLSFARTISIESTDGAEARAEATLTQPELAVTRYEVWFHLWRPELECALQQRAGREQPAIEDQVLSRFVFNILETTAFAWAEQRGQGHPSAIVAEAIRTMIPEA